MFAKIAVITPAYNAAAFIGEAIESVQAQTYADWSMTIVDDGSTDDTAAAVAPYLEDPRIKLVQQENGGCAAGRNTALAHSNSEYVSILDADDRYTPTYLADMIKALEAAPNAAFCTCDAFLFGEMAATGTLSSSTVSRIPPLTLERVITREFSVFIAGAIRRRWIEKVGPFDASMRAAEDFDLWLRLLSNGGEGLYLDKPLVWYRVHSGSLSQSHEQLWAATARAYEKLQTARPDLESLIAPKLDETVYERALIRAKLALKENRPEEFLANAQKALRMRPNRKLAMAATFGKIAPSIAPKVLRRFV